MGAGWELYGRQVNMSQKEWDNLSQAQRDYIKSMLPNAARTYNADPARQAANAQTLADQGMQWGGNGQIIPIQGGDTGSYDDGGYGGGGGGGGGAPLRNLASSPEWLAYLNALGLEEGQFRSDIDRQRAFAKSTAEQQIAQLGPQYDQQRRGVTHRSESAGMERSGGFLKGLADSRAAQGRDTSNINLGLGSTLSGLESSLANKLMDLGARRASQELSLRASGYV